MKNFMVEITLPEDQGYQFMEKIPDQRRVVTEFLEEGLISDYSLSKDRKVLWVTLEVNDINEAEEIVQQFPIIEDVEYEIRELMFRLKGIMNIPQFSLN